MLTEDDRLKFISWLETSARNDDALAKQCDAIKEGAMARKLRNDAMAAMIVAEKLKTTEIVTVDVGS